MRTIEILKMTHDYKKNNLFGSSRIKELEVNAGGWILSDEESMIFSYTWVHNMNTIKISIDSTYDGERYDIHYKIIDENTIEILSMNNDDIKIILTKLD